MNPIVCSECGMSWDLLMVLWPKHTPGCVVCCDRSTRLPGPPDPETVEQVAYVADWMARRRREAEVETDTPPTAIVLR